MQTPSIAERRALVCEEFRAIMKQWDAQAEIQNPDQEQIARKAFLRLKIYGFMRALDALDAEEAQSKVA